MKPAFPLFALVTLVWLLAYFQVEVAGQNGSIWLVSSRSVMIHLNETGSVWQHLPQPSPDLKLNLAATLQTPDQ